LVGKAVGRACVIGGLSRESRGRDHVRRTRCTKTGYA
jgi:hypothetical protein